jgi:hypothetical protein
MGEALHLLSSELEQRIEQAHDLDALVKGKGSFIKAFKCEIRVYDTFIAFGQFYE